MMESSLEQTVSETLLKHPIIIFATHHEGGWQRLGHRAQPEGSYGYLWRCYSGTHPLMCLSSAGRSSTICGTHIAFDECDYLGQA